MIDSGIHHPFLFVGSKKEISESQILYINDGKFILTGNFLAVDLINYVTDSIVLSISSQTYTFNDVTLKYWFLDVSLNVSDLLYLRVQLSTSTYLYSNCVLKGHPCLSRMRIQSTNDCKTQYCDWTELADYISLDLYNGKEIEPSVRRDSSVFVTKQGSITNYSNFQLRYRIQFLGLSSLSRFLESILMNSNVQIQTTTDWEDIINLEIESDAIGDTGYSKFTISFVFKGSLNEENECCRDINIDDIAGIENPGSGNCENFSVTLENQNGVLIPTITNIPGGVIPVYSWYLNNIYLTSAATLEINGSGNYRLDVIASSCRASVSYYKDDPCTTSSLNIIKTGNEINAFISNIQNNPVITYTVEKNGEVLSTILPYLVTENGTYYIRAKWENCTKLSSIYVDISALDCNYNVNIEPEGSYLNADTNATNPLYIWELETKEGITTIGTNSVVNLGGPGVYWLTVISNGCSKKNHYYLPANNESIIYINSMVSGSEFSVLDINLLSIINPAVDLDVLINQTLYSYVSSNPVISGHYTITSQGKIKIFNSLTNGTIKIIRK